MTTMTPPRPARPALAVELEQLLAELPARLDISTEPFPLLSAVRRSSGADVARRVVCLAARVHREADERRTAEYLLRHRHELHAERHAASLIASARFAADRDLRRIRARKTPLETVPLEEALRDEPAARVHDPSVGDAVLAYLQRVTGHRPVTELARDRLLDAVVIAFELAQRRPPKRGSNSIVAMRSNARPQSQLAFQLRAEFGDEVAARSLAHLLVGPVGTPVTSALLWWAAQPDLNSAQIPPVYRARWIADLSDADPVIRAKCRRGYRRIMSRIAACASDSQGASIRRVADTGQKTRLASGTVRTATRRTGI